MLLKKIAVAKAGMLAALALSAMLVAGCAGMMKPQLYSGARESSPIATGAIVESGSSAHCGVADSKCREAYGRRSRATRCDRTVRDGTPTGISIQCEVHLFDNMDGLHLLEGVHSPDECGRMATQAGYLRFLFEPETRRCAASGPVESVAIGSVGTREECESMAKAQKFRHYTYSEAGECAGLRPADRRGGTRSGDAAPAQTQSGGGSGLVGKWLNANDLGGIVSGFPQEGFELFADGTVKQDQQMDRDDGSSGSWQARGNRLTLPDPWGSGTNTYCFEISDSVLILSGSSTHSGVMCGVQGERVMTSRYRRE